MPTIKRMMDVAIVGMVVLDLMLTVLFFTRHRRSAAPLVERQPAVVEKMVDKAPVTQTVAASNTSDAITAMFLLLRQNDISGPQPFVSRSSNAQKWDYGGGAPQGASFHLNQGLMPTHAVASDLPTQPTTNQTNDVSAAMLLLIRAGDVSSEVFDCPSTQPSNRDNDGTAQNWISWNGTATSLPLKTSYSYEDPYPNDHGTTTAGSTKP